MTFKSSERAGPTDKTSKPRLLAPKAKKSASLRPRSRKNPFQAKSRLVVQGRQEDLQAIRSDSPTASLLAFNTVCAVVVMMRWIEIKLLAMLQLPTCNLKGSVGF